MSRILRGIQYKQIFIYSRFYRCSRQKKAKKNPAKVVGQGQNKKQTL